MRKLDLILVLVGFNFDVHKVQYYSNDHRTDNADDDTFRVHFLKRAYKSIYGKNRHVPQ